MNEKQIETVREAFFRFLDEWEINADEFVEEVLELEV